MTSPQQPYTRQQYLDVLTKIKNVSEDREFLGVLFPARIVLMRLCHNEQDNDWEEIGLRRKKEDSDKVQISYFSHSRYGELKDWSINTTGRYFHKASQRFSSITPDSLKTDFLRAIASPIRKYLTEQAKIETKVNDYEERIVKFLK